MSRLDTLRETRSLFVYDTLFCPETPYDGRTQWVLFGNRNIGRRDLCNIDMPGRLCAPDEDYATVTHLLARVAFDTPVEDARRKLDAIEQCTRITLRVGDREHGPVPLLLPVPPSMREAAPENQRGWWEQHYMSPKLRSYAMGFPKNVVVNHRAVSVVVDIDPRALDMLDTNTAFFRVWVVGKVSKEIPWVG